MNHQQVWKGNVLRRLPTGGWYWLSFCKTSNGTPFKKDIFAKFDVLWMIPQNVQKLKILFPNKQSTWAITCFVTPKKSVCIGASENWSTFIPSSLCCSHKTGGLMIVLGALFFLTSFTMIKRFRSHHCSCNKSKDRPLSWLLSNHLSLDIEILHICRPEVKRRMISCKEQAEFGWLSLVLAVVKVQILQNLCMKLMVNLTASESIQYYCCNLSTNQNIFDINWLQMQNFWYLMEIVFQTWIKGIFLHEGVFSLNSMEWPTCFPYVPPWRINKLLTPSTWSFLITTPSNQIGSQELVSLQNLDVTCSNLFVCRKILISWGWWSLCFLPSAKGKVYPEMSCTPSSGTA